MIFNSLSFLIFFPLVTIAYFLCPRQYQWVLLLVASAIFYMAFVPWYILILVVLIIVDYLSGLWIERTVGPKRKVFLLISIIATSLVLFVFKYFNFFNSNIAWLASFLHWNYPIGALRLILPIGLSFHTFQSLSYVIEVYRGRYKAEHHLGIYALYVMFYPQLVAGPIERPQNLLPQFREDHPVKYSQISDGLKMMLRGMFKKVVIADTLALYVAPVFAHPTEYTGISLIAALIYFAWQIYCDFSGYSDIAIGAASVMGFRLSQNFNRPYFATSVTEFWRRWHISLSSWLRDYIFMPLAINKRSWGKWGMIYASLITFLVAGLGHGANWTFVIFGLLQGLALSWELLLRGPSAWLAKHIGSNISKFLGIVYTFSFWAVSLVFFRAQTLADARYIITHLFVGTGEYFVQIFSSLGANVLKPWMLGRASRLEFGVMILCLLFLFIAQIIDARTNLTEYLRSRPTWLRWTLYYGLVFGLLFFGVFSQNQFIYFQF